ncbi:transposase [Candidatus Dojkabacteria bacterium]|nr:transposase [Candidatus Dojkabacteria bacterium]
MAFARAYTRHTAYCARDFLRRLNYLFDLSFSQAYLQRDNGSEFMAEFEEEAEKYDIELITNYVRKPVMNSFVERFNRTLKEESLIYEEVCTVKEANDILKEYIIRYNFLRIHSGIGKKSPFERYSELTFQIPIEYIEEKLPTLSQMLWTSSKFNKNLSYVIYLTMQKYFKTPYPYLIRIEKLDKLDPKTRKKLQKRYCTDDLVANWHLFEAKKSNKRLIPNLRADLINHGSTKFSYQEDQ